MAKNRKKGKQREPENVEEEAESPTSHKFQDTQMTAKASAKMLDKSKAISEDAIRAELFKVMKQYVKQDVHRMSKYFKDLTPEKFQQLVTPNKSVTATQDCDAQLLNLIKYLKKTQTIEFVVGLICALQLRIVVKNKEKVIWMALEIGQPDNGTNVEKEKKMSLSELKSLSRRWRNNLDEHIQDDTDDDVEMTAVQAMTEDSFVFIALSTIKESVTKKSKVVSDSTEESLEGMTTIVTAFNPDHPYLFVHQMHNEDLPESTILSFLVTMPLNYTAFRSVGLEDVGLSAVFDCSKSAVNIVEQLQQQHKEKGSRIEEPPAKRKKLSASATEEDKKGNGYKSLNLSYEGSKCEQESPPQTSNYGSKNGNSLRSNSAPKKIKWT